MAYPIHLLHQQVYATPSTMNSIEHTGIVHGDIPTTILFWTTGKCHGVLQDPNPTRTAPDELGMAVAEEESSRRRHRQSLQRPIHGLASEC
ncbi:hypothetical protein CT0861_02475 [Colletotrichum tofieldiae]|uniref:Uncharacterized protein n=1 Tax=Colletotrichum tofieldiae TaxID=708197 RepID=A0A166MU23_9PEZI|nr:hypothetical protein CT0861_02475 [Colletotrichum tofieldiae]GKT60853.1 hypothetical protein ColTof3_08192 [Colletotrichum tofieldiae]